MCPKYYGFTLNVAIVENCTILLQFVGLPENFKMSNDQNMHIFTARFFFKEIVLLIKIITGPNKSMSN